jgi:hypothetical protein
MKLRILFIIVLAPMLLFAQSAGNSGLSFLKLGFGARNIALGDNGNVFANDVSALFYNPAKLAGSNNTEIMLMHNEWIQDVRTEVLGFKFSLFDLPFGIGINSTSVSDIEVRTNPGDPITTFKAQYFFSSISTGFEIFQDMKFGATAKYIYEDIFTDDAQGYGLDFGLNYKAMDNVNVSAVVKNIGSMNALRSESTKLPTEFRIGPAYNFSVNEYKLNIVVGGEFQKYLDADDSHINFGSEISYDNLFALRLGYQTQYESKSFTGGIGLMWNRVNFDYAFTPFTLGLGVGHTISISYNF